MTATAVRRKLSELRGPVLDRALNGNGGAKSSRTEVAREAFLELNDRERHGFLRWANGVHLGERRLAVAEAREITRGL